jgi:hypothetical protein
MGPNLTWVVSLFKRKLEHSCALREDCVKSKREISHLQAKERGTGESTPADILIFHSKTPELHHNKFLLCMSPVCGALSEQLEKLWQCHRHSYSLQASLCDPVSLSPEESWAVLLPTWPGHTLLTVAWLGLCLWQPPKHHSINSDNLIQKTKFVSEVYLQILFPKDSMLMYIHIIYLKKHFMNLNHLIGAHSSQGGSTWLLCMRH